MKWPQESGVNLVGVLPGSRWGSAEDQVLVVGSSWHLGPPATRDLGSGLAALLEVARVVMADNKFSPDYSVIFVAFDKERDERQGSRAFVEEYLMPHVITRFNCTSQVKQKEGELVEMLNNALLQGLINLETIFSFSDRELSQSLPVMFESENSETVRKLKQTGSRGDFVSLVSRGEAKEARIADILVRQLRKQGVKANHFKFPELAKPPQAIVNMEQYIELWNSSSGRFWFASSKSLPSLAVSDLGRWRGPSTSCTTTTCDTATIRSIFTVRTQFLAAISRALVGTVKEATIRPKVKTNISQTDQRKLYSLLAKFLLNLTAWQGRIEARLATLAIQNQLQHDVPKEKLANNTFLVLGSENVNIPELSHVISDYYGAYNDTKGPANSPMIIKLVT